MSVILRGTETGQQGRRSSLEVHRLPLQFGRDARRVITRLFDPGGEIRVRNVVERVGQLSDDEVEEALEQVRREFSHRHHNLDAVFEENCRTMSTLIGGLQDVSHSRRLLIGSYFTMEYSIASAALFNPSIVAHRNQRNLPEGAVRFILSFRATGRRARVLRDVSHRHHHGRPQHPHGSAGPVCPPHPHVARPPLRQVAFSPQAARHGR